MKKSVGKTEYRELWNVLNAQRNCLVSELQRIEWLIDWIEKREGIYPYQLKHQDDFNNHSRQIPT